MIQILSEPAVVTCPAPALPEPPPMTALQVSTTDAWGGAAKCAQRLNRALPRIGVTSRMLVAQRIEEDSRVIEYNPLSPAPAAVGRAFFRLARKLHRRSVRAPGTYFTFDHTPNGRQLVTRMPAADVVNLHWTSDLLDYRSLPEMARRQPIVWTFHDMNTFTGGCHYTGTCERYTLGCGFCPQLPRQSGPNDLTRRCFERKRRVLESIDPSRLTVVSPSRWLAAEARRSQLFDPFDLRVIPSGLDLAEYRPLDRTEARRRFGLPQNAKVVLFVADLVEDRRKGFSLLLEALQAIRDIPNLLLVTIGRGNADFHGDPGFRHLGPLYDSEELCAAYSAADVFVIPSLQDNFPNTIVEAMACGTPVVGFASGGIGESILDGKTGFLAATGDVQGLVRGLQRILLDPDLQQRMSRTSRSVAEREYSVELQAKRYANLYAEMIGASERLASLAESA